MMLKYLRIPSSSAPAAGALAFRPADAAVFIKRFALASAIGAAATFSTGAFAQAFNGGLPPGSTCRGNCGTLGADGDVGLSGLAGSTAYGYVSSFQGVDADSNGIGYGLGGETNGSELTRIQ